MKAAIENADLERITRHKTTWSCEELRQENLSFLGALITMSWWLNGDIPEATKTDMYNMIAREIGLDEAETATPD